MSLVIRVGVEADAAALAELAARTFREAFAADNRPEDMALHTVQAYGTPQQQRELLDPAIVTLIVEVDAQPAGYAQLRSGVPPACVTGEAPVELWRFYIAQPWHGKGIAQALMRRVESEAYRRGGRTLWLGVWERNERAKAFYRKTGFTDAGSHVFMVGTDAQTDRILVRPLRNADLEDRPVTIVPPDTRVEHGIDAAAATRRFYHGTRADLKPGDLIQPGYSSNYTVRRSPWVYFSETLNAAAWGAELARGDGPGRIYIVEPSGSFMDDPNLTDKKFPGNPTKSYRSSEPLRVVAELRDWQGHSSEEIRAMKDAIAGLEPIDD